MSKLLCEIFGYFKKKILKLMKLLNKNHKIYCLIFLLKQYIYKIKQIIVAGNIF